MKTFLLALAATGVAVLIGLSQAQAEEPAASRAKNWQQSLVRTDLTRRDLSAPGYEALQTRVDFAPGAMSPRHSHPGDEVAFVLEGLLEYSLAGQPPVVLPSGSSLVIPAGTPHVARNVGPGRASELATYFVRKSEPLVRIEE